MEVIIYHSSSYMEYGEGEYYLIYIKDSGSFLITPNDIMKVLQKPCDSFKEDFDPDLYASSREFEKVISAELTPNLDTEELESIVWYNGYDDPEKKDKIKKAVTNARINMRRKPRYSIFKNTKYTKRFYTLTSQLLRMF